MVSALMLSVSVEAVAITGGGGEWVQVLRRSASTPPSTPARVRLHLLTSLDEASIDERALHVGIPR